MSGYITPSRFDSAALAGMVDPDRGFLCMTAHWRPDPDAPDPEMPGQKLAMSSYISLPGRKACLCGSGKRYRDCCQQNHLWHPICPNAGGPDNGFSLLKPQKATFHNLDGDMVRARLMVDRKLRCTDSSPKSCFWVLFGDPPMEDQYGILCFGDIELERNRVLVASAMSDSRMQILLTLLREVVGDVLGEPRMSLDTVWVIDKATGKKRKLRSAGRRARRQRRKR